MRSAPTWHYLLCEQRITVCLASRLRLADCAQCFNVALSRVLSEEEAATLAWLLRETYEPERLTPGSRFDSGAEQTRGEAVVEVPPLSLLSLPCEFTSSLACMRLFMFHQHV